MEAKGRADAEQMTKKAEAFQQYKDGAMVDMLLEKLPLVRRNELRSPIQPLVNRCCFLWSISFIFHLPTRVTNIW